MDVMDAVISFVEEVAPVLGSQVIPLFELTISVTATCFDPNEAYLIRDRTMGMLSTVFNSIGQASANYLERAMPLVEQGLRDKSAGVRQNSAYALRVLCEELKEQLLPHYPAFLQVCRASDGTSPLLHSICLIRRPKIICMFFAYSGSILPVN